MYFKPRFPDRRGLTSARWAKDIFRKMSSVRTPTSKPLTKRENSPFLEPQGWFIRAKLLTLQECGFDFCYLLDDLVENPKRSFSPTPPTLPAHVVIPPSTRHTPGRPSQQHLPPPLCLQRHPFQHAYKLQWRIADQSQLSGPHFHARSLRQELINRS